MHLFKCIILFEKLCGEVKFLCQLSNIYFNQKRPKHCCHTKMIFRNKYNVWNLILKKIQNNYELLFNTY